MKDTWILRACVFAMIAMIGGLSGCKSEEDAVKAPGPRISLVEILPSNPEPGEVLAASANYLLGERESLEYLEYKWYVNGKETKTMIENKLNTDNLAEGDEIYVEARAKSNKGFGAWARSAEVELMVKEYVIESVALEPRQAYNDSELKALVALDKQDVEYPDLYYQWFVNDEELPTEFSAVLGPGNFEQGDEVYVRVSADGDFDSIKVKESNSVKILNRNPEVISGPEFEIDGSRVNFWVEAEDADNDDLKFTLISGPPGTKFNSRTGEGYWTLQKNALGDIRIIIKVEDGHGGWARREGLFSLSYQEPTPVE